ncbi:MAG: antibiotic biosynthesis monooxygenase [Gemmatimonadota bacterium]
MNIVRNVTFQIKPGKTAEFTKVLHDQVLPVMKLQPGFKHELAMHNGNSAVGLSVWQDQPSADRYQSAAYPEVLKQLAGVIEGTPRVENYELAVSTLAG